MDWDIPAREPEDNSPETDENAIEALLDEGYAQLDGFVAWLEEATGSDTRTAQQDCFNAEALLDYLANRQHKSAYDINEFELRWFVFSQYVRKAMADEETEARLPDSLLRFFGYLQSRHGYLLPEWLTAALDDRAFYMARRQAYADLNPDDERKWESGYRLWCEELEDDLDTRCLWLPREMGDAMQWGDVMGWREATLHDEANRLWQEQRAELLSQGLDFEAVRAELDINYLSWIDEPQRKLDDSSPREVISIERAERAEHEKPGDDPDDGEDE